MLVEFFRTERPDEGWCGDERGDSPEQCAIHVMRAQAKQLKSYRDALERQSEAAHAERTHLLAQLAAARVALQRIHDECGYQNTERLGRIAMLASRALAAHQEERL